MLPSCNLQPPYATKVVLFLVNHKNEQCNSVLLDIFKRISPSREDILLHEDIVDAAYAELDIQKKCWEKAEIVTSFEEKSKIFDQHYDIALHFYDSSYSTKYRLEVAKKILAKAKKANINTDKLNIEQIGTWLNDSVDYSTELTKASQSLSLMVKKLFTLFKNKTVMKTFHERQTTLIEEIKSSLKFRRVFVICGSHHGKADTSIFPSEVDRLLSFLKENAPFEIFDTTNK